MTFEKQRHDEQTSKVTYKTMKEIEKKKNNKK